ncbi:MAG: MinD/ParA family protein [Oculatellaceae cyanobacterium bins.114]|nr:MinD/ParA family protein [Oculatellaceae cyanobacterium bins.114]
MSVHSFRGGTGKSNLVANLSGRLAVQGYRVGVIDTDIQSPGIHVLFGLDVKKVKYTLNDYLLGRCSVEEAAFDVSPTLIDGADRVAASGGKIYLIPSSMKVNEITTVLSEGYDVGLLTSGYSQLCQKLNLDYLLIDTHPGINEETLLSIGISQLLIVILRPDYQDYQGTALTVKVAKELDVPGIVLLVNKVLSDYDFNEIRQEMEKTYDVPVAAVLPQSDEMMRLASRQIFCLCYPDHPITKLLDGVVAKITA